MDQDRWISVGNYAWTLGGCLGAIFGLVFVPGSSESWISFTVIVVVVVGVYLSLYFSGRQRGSGSSSGQGGGQGGDQGGDQGDRQGDRLGRDGQGVDSVRQSLSSEQATELRALLEAIIQNCISKSLSRTQTDLNQVSNSDAYVIDFGPHDEVADGIIIGTLQKKPQQPRNSLIDEVVAFDKSKLIKVERTEPPVEAKEEGGEYQLKRSQLREVRERVNAPVEQNAEEECSLKHLRLRKVGERVNSAGEPKFEEKGFLPEQLQLRKVTDGIINGTLQMKPQQPRNPLIDEVVAFDKSKLREVERTKPPVEAKEEEGGEYRLKRLQLREVGEMEKAPVEQNAEEEFSQKQLQLRKVGERVNLAGEPIFEEKGFLPEQLQLRKVRERVEFELKAEETEFPRLQLRKVGERAQTQVEEKVEERDSLFEQIRNKKYSLKPAVSARPNFQGPRTNSKVAVILEKARTIRQAMAGSDEDEDGDSWSDS